MFFTVLTSVYIIHVISEAFNGFGLLPDGEIFVTRRCKDEPHLLTKPATADILTKKQLRAG